ncbi:GyrI-like domain-containing protein [Oceanobacillus chungangensis]|uniref:GyrI-like domain-containing protein n=1 Tax=Oceanobacillus chungangensis TaxID=1229152 RepID=UPI001B88422B|nr:GyrI-like domain-containing protein [Oceanobacillus chungangensis]
MDEVTFDNIEDGLSLQMLHLGSYDEESQTFEIMNAFLEENQLKRTSLTHREIYLSEFRKVEKAKLKTVLRYPVKKSD